MKNKINTEKNIQKLLREGFNKEHQPTDKLKEHTLKMLMQKVALRKTLKQPDKKMVIAFSLIWLVTMVLVFYKAETSIYLGYLLKFIIGLSLIFIPISSIVLIIFNKKRNEEKMA